jgi:hypothetical protein
LELLKCIQSTANVGTNYVDDYANKVVYHTGNKPTAADVGAIGYQRALTSADNLDTLFDNGIYQYNTGNAPSNAPYDNASIVEVFGSGSTSAQKIQRVTRYGLSGYTKIRVLTGGAWTDWAEYATTDYAVNKAGDIFGSGAILRFISSASVGGGLQAFSDGFNITAYNDANNTSSDRRGLRLYPPNKKDNADALRISNTVSGSVTWDTVLHTGNVVASATDITAGSSASWQQYLVYE